MIVDARSVSTRWATSWRLNSDGGAVYRGVGDRRTFRPGYGRRIVCFGRFDCGFTRAGAVAAGEGLRRILQATKSFHSEKDLKRLPAHLRCRDAVRSQYDGVHPPGCAVIQRGRAFSPQPRHPGTRNARRDVFFLLIPLFETWPWNIRRPISRATPPACDVRESATQEGTGKVDERMGRVGQPLNFRLVFSPSQNKTRPKPHTG